MAVRLRERAASSLGCVYTCGRLSLDTASHTVLDEPVNGLDPEGIIEIRELILKLNREHGITVLISSHILDELAKLATHYGFIDSGRIVRELSADELESASRKCLQLTVSDTVSLAMALDKLAQNIRSCPIRRRGSTVRSLSRRSYTHWTRRPVSCCM